jgi:aspartate ammonia-lyase
LGGTAIGTEINCPKSFRQLVIKKLAVATEYPLRSASDLIYSTQYCDPFLEVGATLTILSSNLIKFLNDLRLLASGPNTGLNEISFASVQSGSTIMPGKINPVMAEALTQICFQTIGNYQTMLLSAQAGQLELNVMLPIMYRNLFESLELITNGVRQFAKLGMSTITANKENCEGWLDKNITARKTTLINQIGFDEALKK